MLPPFRKMMCRSEPDDRPEPVDRAEETEPDYLTFRDEHYEWQEEESDG